MDDSRIPWWLILLLGVAVAGLAVWQSSRWTLQLRLRAATLALIYLAMLAFVIGGDPHTGTTARVWRLADLLTAGLCGVSVLSAVFLAGRPQYRGQLVWFGLLSLSNAGICAVFGLVGIASMLAITAIGIVVLLVRSGRNGPLFTVSELWPGSKSEPSDEPPAMTWLSGATGLLAAVVLVGTCYYSLHAESMRATPSRRHSTMPSRARLRTVLDLDSDNERSFRLLDQLFGHRADIAVLLAALIFVSLASAMSVNRIQSSGPADPSDEIDPGDPTIAGKAG